MIFKQRQGKRFNYKPKYQSDNTEKTNDDFQSSWDDLKNSRKRKSSILSSPIVLVLFLIAIAVLMYVLGRYE